MGPGVMLFVVIIALVCGFAGQAIGRPKGYPGAGLTIGLLLGVFGVVIVALMPETEAVKAARAQWQYQAQWLRHSSTTRSRPRPPGERVTRSAPAPAGSVAAASGRPPPHP